MGTYARASGTKQLGGTQTRADATATYLCDEHFWSTWRALDRARGRLAVVAVGNVYGDDGTPMVGGEPITLRGILKTVPVPKGDFSSNNGNEIPLVLSLDAEAA